MRMVDMYMHNCTDRVTQQRDSLEDFPMSSKKPHKTSLSICVFSWVWLYYFYSLAVNFVYLNKNFSKQTNLLKSYYFFFTNVYSMSLEEIGNGLCTKAETAVSSKSVSKDFFPQTCYPPALNNDRDPYFTCQIIN